MPLLVVLHTPFLALNTSFKRKKPYTFQILRCFNFVGSPPRNNARISSQRVLIENIIRELKNFRILSEKYRNRRKKYGLRFNLIAAIYNRNLGIKLIAS